MLDASLFIFRLEDEIKKVKFEIERTKRGRFSKLFTELNENPWRENEGLELLKIWFLRIIQNTELEHGGSSLEPIGLISYKALETERIPPFKPRYPFLLWMLCQFERNHIADLFGDSFYVKMAKLVQSNGLTRWLGDNE